MMKVDFLVKLDLIRLDTHLSVFAAFKHIYYPQLVFAITLKEQNLIVIKMH